MPNHIANRVIIDGSLDDIKKIMNFVRSEESPFDFNKIVPMPETYEGYDWRCRHWGTKWNCYDVVVLDEGAFEFNTAWSAPLPVMQALSEIFPEVIINLDWADEDAGCNTGEATYEGGDETSLVYFDNCSEEAWEQFFRLHEGDEEFYERDEDGRWRLKEDW